MSSTSNNESNLIDINDIVSSNTLQLKLDDTFKKMYDMSEYDLEIVKNSVTANMGMTEYQCQQFVTNSQLTPYKMVRQALLEIETRYHAYFEIQTSLRKSEIQRKKLIKQRDAITDELDKELVQIDIDKLDYDITIYKRKFAQSESEINAFLSVVKKYAPDEESLAPYLEINEEEEKKYWIARMGKQAALDIIAYGRVGSGNMDSIAMMPQEDQLDTLQLAVQYSGLVNAGLHKVSVGVQDTVDHYLEKNDTSIPQLLDKVYNGDRLEQLQLAAQPKTSGESI
jgi:hypothetical protein